MKIKGVFLWWILFHQTTSIYTGNGSYNSFRYQLGYCKLQSFDSHSRETTGSVPMFLDGRILMGVGLNNHQFQDDMGSCGRCLRVQDIRGMPFFEKNLTSYDTSRPILTPFYAMVMDQCKDPVCTDGYLDFDIYSPIQPVEHGNPTGIVWDFAPCPVLSSEPAGMLVCLNNTCHASGNNDYPTWGEAWEKADPYYIAFYFRNTRYRIETVRLRLNHALGSEIITNENGWVWRPVRPPSPGDVLSLEIQSAESLEEIHRGQWRLEEWFSKPTESGYDGGLLIHMD